MSQYNPNWPFPQYDEDGKLLTPPVVPDIPEEALF